MNGKLASRPAPVALIPAGDHAFKLLPLNDSEVRTSKYAISFSA